MAITKRPPKDKADEFINGAPDGAGRKGVKRGSQVQITLTLPEGMLGEVEALARSWRQSRAGLIRLAISMLLEGGLGPAGKP